MIDPIFSETTSAVRLLLPFAPSSAAYSDPLSRYTHRTHDPFAHLSLEEIPAAERKYRDQHPVLWWVAEFVMFVREPWRSVRGWWWRRVIGYGAVWSGADEVARAHRRQLCGAGSPQ